MNLDNTTRQPPSTVEGVCLRLRLVHSDDAPYIQRLRSDPRYNTHLSRGSGTVEDQRRWIEGYKAQEADGREFYYVIERKDGDRCGVVRLYDITKDRFTWGSWILDENKPSKAALESAVLSFGVAFENLRMAFGHIEVRKQNSHAIAFYRRLGMQETHEDSDYIYFEYTSERFATDRLAHMVVIAGA